MFSYEQGTPVVERVRPAAVQGHSDSGLARGGSGKAYRGALLIRNILLLGPCRRSIRRVIWRSQGGGLFLMSEVSLYQILPTLDVKRFCGKGHGEKLDGGSI